MSIPCPQCGHRDSSVLDSRRPSEHRAARFPKAGFWRRRRCDKCGFRFTTSEQVFIPQKSEGTILRQKYKLRGA